MWHRTTIAWRWGWAAFAATFTPTLVSITAAIRIPTPAALHNRIIDMPPTNICACTKTAYQSGVHTSAQSVEDSLLPTRARMTTMHMFQRQLRGGSRTKGVWIRSIAMPTERKDCAKHAPHVEDAPPPEMGCYGWAEQEGNHGTDRRAREHGSNARRAVGRLHQTLRKVAVDAGVRPAFSDAEQEPYLARVPSSEFKPSSCRHHVYFFKLMHTFLN